MSAFWGKADITQTYRNSAFMATVNESNPRNEIERLEAEIDELTARIESCRKFILAGRIAVMGGAAVLIAMLVGGIQFNPSVVGIAGAAVLGNHWLCMSWRRHLVYCWFASAVTNLTGAAA